MIPSTHAQIYALHSCSSLPIQGVCDINLFSFCGDIIGSAVHLFHHFHAYFTYFVVSYMYMAAYRFLSSHCHALINMLSWASLSPFFCCLICFLTIGVSLPMLFAHTRFMCILGYSQTPSSARTYAFMWSLQIQILISMLYQSIYLLFITTDLVAAQVYVQLYKLLHVILWMVILY